VDSKSFEVISDLAYPQNTSAMNSLQGSGLLQPGSNVNQINLIGNVNYLRIEGDSIFAELPYFGERQMNVSYNGADSSVIIENILQNYEVKPNEKDNSVLISFNAKAQTEILRFTLTLYPNMKTSMFLNGPTRFPIRYTGNVKPVE
ncbi:MAG: DUF4251 domain-containing protein, partial [Psychroserpens sp.]|nr:DUF4251 domain-containing protein [Psychroserpens sp.]